MFCLLFHYAAVVKWCGQCIWPCALCKSQVVHCYCYLPCAAVCFHVT